MTENLEYNSERSKLIIPEYGRHIQKMVEHAMEIGDKEERNMAAHTIIDVMGNLSPHLRDVPDFQHKLWDQLFLMSDYQLDVDSPYPKPTREEREKKPTPLAYPENNPKYRFYGNNIKLMIDEVKDWEAGPKKEGIILTIANHMKKSYLNWNRDAVDDNIIFEHLYELSNGKINLKKKDEDLSDASDLIRGKKSYKSKRKRHHGKGRKRH